MPVLALMEAAALLPGRGALIGLDLGTKTIGVAASHPDRRLAAPVEPVARKRFGLDAQRLLDLAAERRAAGFGLGLPINMDGTEGTRAQSTRAFARNLAKLTALPIALWDERLSTAAVERALIAADASRAKRKAVIDQHPASYILQGALHRLARAAPRRRHPGRTRGRRTCSAEAQWECAPVASAVRIVFRCTRVPPTESRLAGPLGLGL